MCVPVGDAAGREVDAVAAHDPVGERATSIDGAREQRRPPVAPELPDERGPVHLRRAEMGRVVRDVVDDTVPARVSVPVVNSHGGDRSDRRATALISQWKYWPPSMTMVWPVTNADDGPAR